MADLKTTGKITSAMAIAAIAGSLTTMQLDTNEVVTIEVEAKDKYTQVIKHVPQRERARAIAGIVKDKLIKLPKCNGDNHKCEENGKIKFSLDEEIFEISDVKDGYSPIGSGQICFDVEENGNKSNICMVGMSTLDIESEDGIERTVIEIDAEGNEMEVLKKYKDAPIESIIGGGLSEFKKKRDSK